MKEKEDFVQGECKNAQSTVLVRIYDLTFHGWLIRLLFLKVL